MLTAHKRSDPISLWTAALRERVGWQKAAVALANKNARILWAVMTQGEAFDPPTLGTSAPNMVCHRRRHVQPWLHSSQRLHHAAGISQKVK